MATSTRGRRARTLPSPLHGDARSTIPRRSASATATSPCQTTLSPLEPSPTTTLLTQNLISETLADTTPAVNQTLPNLESLARVVQRSRASSSGSAQHTEATTSEDFILPPTCTSTRRDEPFVLYDGKTDRGVRVIAFSTTRNMKTLAQYPDWIADGTFYVAPKIFPQSYTIHPVVDLKCLPLIYILAGDKKGDTYSYVLNIMKYFFDQHCPVDMVEGFHRGFKTRVNRPKPSVQEYVRAVREEQVMTDYHLDRLSVGKTPSKRRRTCHTHLYDICSFYSTYPSKIEYVFAVAKYFGNDIE